MKSNFLFFLLFLISCSQEQKIKNTINNNTHKPVIINGLSIDSLGFNLKNNYKVTYFDKKIITFSELDNNNLEKGLHVEFHDNQTIYIIGTIQNGYYEGEVKTYSKKGLLLEYEVMSNGKIIESLTHEKIDSVIRLDMHIPQSSATKLNK